MSFHLRNAAQAVSRSSGANGRFVMYFHAPRRHLTIGPTSNASTNTSHSGLSGVGTHLAAAFGGGAAVLLAGACPQTPNHHILFVLNLHQAYGWYYFSGVKKTVDTARSAQAHVKQTAATIAEKAPEVRNEAVRLVKVLQEKADRSRKSKDADSKEVEER